MEIPKSVAKLLPKMTLHEPGLWFTPNLDSIWKRLDLAAVLELGDSLGVEALILEAIEEDNSPTEGMVCLPVKFKTHAYGDTGEWGWSPGRSICYPAMDLHGFYNGEYHLLAQCESVLLILGEMEGVINVLSSLLNDNSRMSENFLVLKDVAKVIFGTSCHNGDFAWFNDWLF